MIIEEFGDAAHERVTYEVRFNVLRDREGKQVGAYQTAFDVSDPGQRPGRAGGGAGGAAPEPRRWRRWASSPAAWRTTSTTCSRPIIGALDLLRDARASAASASGG